MFSNCGVEMTEINYWAENSLHFFKFIKYMLFFLRFKIPKYLLIIIFFFLVFLTAEVSSNWYLMSFYVPQLLKHILTNYMWVFFKQKFSEWVTSVTGEKISPKLRWFLLSLIPWAWSMGYFYYNIFEMGDFFQHFVRVRYMDLRNLGTYKYVNFQKLHGTVIQELRWRSSSSWESMNMPTQECELLRGPYIRMGS